MPREHVYSTRIPDLQKWCGKIAVLLMLTHPLLAQTGLIRVRATDVTGNVIPQAEIRLLGSHGKFKAILHANRLGQAAVSGLSDGNYRLRIQASGYVTKDITVDLQPGGSARMLDISLDSKREKAPYRRYRPGYSRSPRVS